MKNISLQFGPLYFLGICILSFVLIIWLPDSLFAPLNRTTAYLAGLCLNLFGRQPVVAGDIIFLSGFRVQIITECTALYCMVLYGSFVMSAPVALLSRLKGLLTGISFLFTVNTLRIAVVVMVGAVYPGLFEIVHVYLMQVVMLLMVVGLAMAWWSWETSSLRAFILAALFFPIWLAFNQVYVMEMDRLVTALFAVLDYEIFIPQQHVVNFQTFNIVLLAALLGAEQRLPIRRRIKYALVGGGVLAAGHLLFRIGNVLLTAFDWGPALQLSIAITVCGEYLLPVLFWLWASRGPSGKRKTYSCPL